ncbi:MAG: SPOR domain-containing protein [Candidatus Cardinium sp.]|uniref:SPOR domain-containing protein n=1 Tax=Cardinium endosymbiont of Dermatophagoides farinae TaxID=2597823 RepID=UPI0011834C83|nr:SPOR domain-containing protein [Cardinium endosymbiont of Dermatophagoides farinae]TSJ81453.1 SPOR domain-containing protein [Cardinium endosymbiont of Dermatophagoides farinae]UWW96432.1 MAG: SPOR domain-containing protein [Candidatus Cardinium sp.]
MSTNLTDNKFGLPKPDFQALPKKKGLSPILVIIGIVLMLIAAKMSYNFYFKAAKNSRSSAETVNSGPVADQGASITAPSSAQAPPEMGSNTSGTIHQSGPGCQTFNHKKNSKVKKSISATQKELAVKQNKPLVKPGTYQELKEPQGIYHLVVVSYLDKRAAMKVVEQLMKKKLGVYLILPRKGEKYYRVTIGHSKTRYEAERKLEHFKSTYNQLFILKY